MPITTFLDLRDWLEDRHLLRSSRGVTIEEQLMIFLPQREQSRRARPVPTQRRNHLTQLPQRSQRAASRIQGICPRSPGDSVKF
jgi:hypothetical protein